VIGHLHLYESQAQGLARRSDEDRGSPSRLGARPSALAEKARDRLDLGGHAIPVDASRTNRHAFWKPVGRARGHREGRLAGRPHTKTRDRCPYDRPTPRRRIDARASERPDLRLVIRPDWQGYVLSVHSRFGSMDYEAHVTSLDSSTPHVLSAATWLEERTGMPRRRVLAAVARAGIAEIAREVVAAT
jgi:hypothetical protein